MLLKDFIIRVFDILGVLICLVILSPIFIVIAIFIKLDSKGPVLFRQQRLGRRGIEFTILKFRTMTLDTCLDKDSKWASVGDSRITRVGHKLRKYHLDELPQLLNILLGDMSFVGPRPFRAGVHKLIREIEPNWDKRLAYKPGLTGYAQLFAHKGCELNDHALKLKYDLKMESLNPLTYIQLIFRTPLKIISGSSH